MFEFDPEKSRRNKEKHGIDFIEAQALFLAEPLVIPARHDGDEERSLVIGTIDGTYWSAIITRRGSAIRIISVRRSRVSERRLHDQAR